ncbi:hypothetical protein RHMOL_Rhmol05G0029100 [Rhododendron molle]|uniref:Uncharacterized protein n=1 Tax=Rhododendron molle TaxID=49168 RepID=A0ACC0NK16_RHOML|nr:hypothetical protein RHMOL_Rhmol05G0029100 [Rhododendron molle]
MASKLKQLQSTACQVQKLVAKHGTGYYKQLLEQNKQYIQEPPTLEKCNLLSKQLFYTRLASIPGRYESFWKELDHVKLLLKNRSELKVEDVGIAALFGLECFAWFCGVYTGVIPVPPSPPSITDKLIICDEVDRSKEMGRFSSPE